ncbi:MAG: hypothetical protein ACTS9Y_02110 [Methylophilus sp.]|uniref:hypothetical protein n=1 Tax=Methylophilus sp. TaxID=29541 RepID=UPI003FA04D21
MKTVMRLAVVGTLGFASMQTFALGFEPLPSSPSGSAYINCYNTNRVIPPTNADEVKGNFGSYPIPATSVPTTTANNTCFVAKPTFESTAPLSGYTLIATRSTVIPTSMGAGGDIGTIVDRVWRNAANDTCLFGTRITMNSNDHDLTTPSTQYFAVNDIARGGYSGSGTVNIAYTIFSTSNTSAPIYRVGRSFTSVQHRAKSYDTLANKTQNGIGYLDLPTIGGSSTLNINGVHLPIASWVTATATASQQEAQINSNWVDFTTDTIYSDGNGSGSPLSATTYIQASCDASNPNDTNSPWLKAGAIRLRQTGQENSNFKEFVLDGYAPPGATVP